MFDSLVKMFKRLRRGQVYLSGLRRLVKGIERKWYWVKPGGRERKVFLNFLDYVREQYGFRQAPLCCLFIFQIFPRIFFEKYTAVRQQEKGFLEYKIPIYAKIFHTPFYKKDLGVCWFCEDQRPLNAKSQEIPVLFIKRQLKKRDGWRIFHPFYKIWKM